LGFPQNTAKHREALQRSLHNFLWERKELTKQKDNPDVLKVPEVARRLRVTKAFAYRLIREKKLPALVLGGAVRVPRAAFERLVASGRD
jgi:excisionase family DNA binding protein